MKKGLFGLSAVMALALALSGCDTATNMPNPVAHPNVKASRINAELGLAFLKDNDPVHARSKLLLALKQGPFYPPAYDAMAYFLEQTGNKPGAGKYYRKALSLNPSSGKAQNNYGAFLCREKHYKESIAYFISATKDKNYLTPAAAYENAGFCSLAIPNKMAAARYFKRTLQEDPRRVVAALELGELSFARGDIKQAQQYLSRYSLAAENSPQSLWLKVRIEQKLGDLNAADSTALLLEGKFPNSAQAKLVKDRNLL